MTTPEKHTTMYNIVAPLIALASAAMCYFLGQFAELFYEQEDTFQEAGWKAGIILGLAAASYYLSIVHKKRKCPIFSARFLMYATLTGTAAGVGAATALHIILMIAYGTFKPLILTLGIAFGAAAGSILGIISAALLKKAYNIKPQTNSEQQTTE